MDLMGVIFRRIPESEQLVSALCLGAGTSSRKRTAGRPFFSWIGLLTGGMPPSGAVKCAARVLTYGGDRSNPHARSITGEERGGLDSCHDGASVIDKSPGIHVEVHM